MKRKIKAVIFDLDGVITQTASVHAKAWKQLFDAYNEERSSEGKEKFKEFSLEEDYPIYIDGKPRYNGVQSFLDSRKIELPYGDPTDGPEKDTVCGLGNLKNEFFHKIISEEGVHTIKENVQKVTEWKARGLKVGIISSSRNCKEILEAAGVDGIFDVRVDGVISAERNLRGKPEPDIFLEAARELQVEPEETVVVEDALAGVKAGKKGNFMLIIGISSEENKSKMYEYGADIVVENLEEYELFSNDQEATKLPHALEHIEKVKNAITSYGTLLCLDYDGTLTPIVDDYKKAVLTQGMRAILNECAKKIPTAVVSGRDIKFIQEQVALENIYYAGSHGFEIEGPGGFVHEVEESSMILPSLDEAEEELNDKTRHTKGVEIERKKFAIAIHYRHVDKNDMDYLENVVSDILDDHPLLKRGGGKKVIELKPNIRWNKGKAVELLCKQIIKGNEPATIIYIGDDETDEDAFQVIQNGYGILVGHPGQKTAAKYYLTDVDEVRTFLLKIKE